MKSYKAALSSLVLLSFTASVTTAGVSFSTSVRADSTPPAPTKLALNPENLRKTLLEGNLSIIQAMNQIHDAKDQVVTARMNLLPSVSLGALLSPNPLLSSLQFLLPFLLPSSWFNLFQQKDLFESQKLSYKILELNAYESALAVYYTVMADEQTKNVYLQEADDFKKIYEQTKMNMDLLGIASQEDVDQAKGNMDKALVQAKNSVQLSQSETASLRGALGLPLSTEITENASEMPASPWEDQDIQKAVDQAMKKDTPEVAQIDDLISAANNARWSTVFSFINSVTAAGTSSGGGSNNGSGVPQPVGLSTVTVTGKASIGFAMIPTIELSNRNIEEIKLQIVALERATTQTLEATLKNITVANSQLKDATDEEDSLQNVYQSKLMKYDLGIGPFLDVLVARTQLAGASNDRINAQLTLNILRATLHRTMLSDEFSKIQGCVLPQPTSNFWHSIGGIFGEESHTKLEDVCREGGNNLPAKP